MLHMRVWTTDSAAVLDLPWLTTGWLTIDFARGGTGDGAKLLGSQDAGDTAILVVQTCGGAARGTTSSTALVALDRAARDAPAV